MTPHGRLGLTSWEPQFGDLGNLPKSRPFIQFARRPHHSGREFCSWLGLVPRQHSTGARNLLPKSVFHDRPCYQEEHTAQLIVAKRHCSPAKGRILLRRPVDRLSLFPSSRAADHTLSGDLCVMP
jgi:hypothetical protein